MCLESICLLSRRLAVFVVFALYLSGGAIAIQAVGNEALDYAFRFASAIDPDPKDKAKAQELVVREYAARGDLDEAVSRAGMIENWRRGVVYADLARQLAGEGRHEEARALIEEARSVRDSVAGWQNPRISAHIAEALAALGDLAKSREISAEVADQDPQAYAGRSVATVATGYAAKRNFDAAMEQLAILADEHDVYETWWRTQGYLDLGRSSDFTDEQRLEALDAAKQSAAEIAGWKQAQMLQGVAAEYHALGKTKKARGVLRQADEVILAGSPTLTARAAMLSILAGAWAGIGDRKHAADLLELAEEAVPNNIVIDQPGVYAMLAESYVRMEDPEDSRRLFDTALDSAEALVNARPRALAVVAICRSMGRSGIELDEAIRGRLDALFAGLKDPW
jgi:tetratricopeptide (TPR) repeat protein